MNNHINKNMEIVSSIWYGIKIPVFNNRLIGIIAVKDKLNQRMKLYIGIGKGENQELDENHILQYGVPFYPGFLIDWLADIISYIEE